MPYSPFYERFRDLAAKETRNFYIKNHKELPDDHYVFHELFCDEEECDCRRVFFNVTSETTGEILAVIAYGWESRKYYAEWMGIEDESISHLCGVSLNMASHQSEIAPKLLNFAKETLLSDITYVERLKRHYRLYRSQIEEEHRPKKSSENALKVSRNEPCPCGSKLKYKKCCGDPVKVGLLH
jgi:hypothetical protein